MAKKKRDLGGTTAQHLMMIRPATSLLCKLGSIMVHAEEFLSPKGHEFDRAALDQLINDPEVREWREEMERAALLPVKR